MVGVLKYDSILLDENNNRSNNRTNDSEEEHTNGLIC